MRYSAKRSSSDFIGFVRTRAMAPLAFGPSLSKSAFRPAPASTRGAVIEPGVEGASAKETTRKENRYGETTAADADSASQRAGASYDSSLTESTPARRKTSIPHCSAAS